MTTRCPYETYTDDVEMRIAQLCVSPTQRSALYVFIMCCPLEQRMDAIKSVEVQIADRVAARINVDDDDITAQYVPLALK